MPELPEVETAKRGIEPHICGQVIQQAVVRNGSLRWPVPVDLSALVQGQTVQAVHRRAKYILIRLDHGYILIHLGMTGNLRVLPANTPAQKHDHVDVVLSNQQILRYVDPRRFGTIQWVANIAPHLDGVDIPKDQAIHPLLANLGPEPLTEAFTGERLYQLSRGRQVAVKNFIMSNAVVVGVGNIYASESLFAAGILPTRPAGKISLTRYKKLAAEIKTVLAQAIEAGGTTLKDFVTADGSPGYFRISLNVYDRKGEACVNCDTLIKSKVIGQRNSFYCSHCQS